MPRLPATLGHAAVARAMGHAGRAALTAARRADAARGELTLTLTLTQTRTLTLTVTLTLTMTLTLTLTLTLTRRAPLASRTWRSPR